MNYKQSMLNELNNISLPKKIPFKLKSKNYFIAKDKLLSSTSFSCLFETSHPNMVAKVSILRKDKKKTKTAIALHNESKIYKKISKHSEVPHFYKYEENYSLNVCYLLIERLHDISTSLFYDEDGLCEKQSIEFCKNVVNCVKMLSLNNLVHNDIKIDNLMLRDLNQVVLIDYGMTYTKEYMEKRKSFRGNIMYCSVRSHYANHKRNNIDDLESAVYCIVKILSGCELPWEKMLHKDISKISLYKKITSIESLCCFIPNIKIQKIIMKLTQYISLLCIKRINTVDYDYIDTFFYDI